MCAWQCESSAATSPVPSGSISPTGATGVMVGQEVGRISGTTWGTTGAGQEGGGEGGWWGSCFDVSVDVLVLGEAGLVR